MVVTLAERKHRETERLRAAAASVAAELAAYAERHGGRFLAFGSAARAEITFSSDFDLIVDFPAQKERAARDYAEAACRRYDIRPDVHLLPDISPALAERVRRDGIVLKCATPAGWTSKPTWLRRSGTSEMPGRFAPPAASTAPIWLAIAAKWRSCTLCSRLTLRRKPLWCASCACCPKKRHRAKTGIAA